MAKLYKKKIYLNEVTIEDIFLEFNIKTVNGLLKFFSKFPKTAKIEVIPWPNNALNIFTKRIIKKR